MWNKKHNKKGREKTVVIIEMGIGVVLCCIDLKFQIYCFFFSKYFHLKMN